MLTAFSGVKGQSAGRKVKASDALVWMVPKKLLQTAFAFAK